MVELSIVLPVFREARRLNHSLEMVAEFVNSYEGGAEAIFVNDGSPDKSAAVISQYIEAHPEYPIKLISYALNQGKGFAVKKGVMESEGVFVLMSDTDLSTPLKDCSKLMKGMAEGADIVCGSRAVLGAEIGHNPPLLRRLLSRVFNILVRISGVHGIRDTQCGFKLFKTDVARLLFQKMRIRGFAFDVELIARAKASSFKVVEVPVHWDYSGHSTVRVFTHGSRMLFDVFVLALKRVCRGQRSLDVRNGEI